MCLRQCSSSGACQHRYIAENINSVGGCSVCHPDKVLVDDDPTDKREPNKARKRRHAQNVALAEAAAKAGLETFEDVELAEWNDVHQRPVDDDDEGAEVKRPDTPLPPKSPKMEKKEESEEKEGETVTASQPADDEDGSKTPVDVVVVAQTELEDPKFGSQMTKVDLVNKLATEMAEEARKKKQEEEESKKEDNKENEPAAAEQQMKKKE
jgi:hypothetical protein